MKFWKVVLASIVGGLITVFLIFFISGAFIAGLASSVGKSSGEVEEHTVLRLNLNYSIPDRSTDGPTPVVGLLGFDIVDAVGLDDILACLEYAATDERIAGIWLESGISAAGSATNEELREALVQFQESGKFILSYGEFFNESSLYLTAIADRSYLNPSAYGEFNGFAATPVYFKRMLDKLGVQVEVFYYGQFKSATEPFRLDKMSDANRLQLREYLESIHNHYLNRLAADRNTSPEVLDSIADNLLVMNGLSAVAHGLVDATLHQDEFIDSIRARVYNDSSDKKFPVMTIGQYRNAVKDDLKKDLEDDWIALVYMEGDVLDGESDYGSIGGATYRKLLADIRENSSVKAVVLRLNTPGGSALTSDILNRAVAQFPDSVPVVVSMGNVCASAGYSIASASDYIIAQPNTVTGSIGIFGLYPVLGGFLEDKIGLTTDTVLTNRYADMGNTFRNISDFERQRIQAEIDQGYEDFVASVAAGRGMTIEQVKELAQGRIYSGLQAIDLGLVDELGGLQDAIDKAAELAELEKYYVRSYPPKKDFFKQLMEQADDAIMAKASLTMDPALQQAWAQWQYLQKVQGLQQRLPFIWQLR